MEDNTLKNQKLSRWGTRLSSAKRRGDKALRWRLPLRRAAQMLQKTKQLYNISMYLWNKKQNAKVEK